MNSENIKTGLKLSEAIKLLEENEGALITVHNATYDWLDYDYLFNSSLAVIHKKSIWDVKLPPPKTVTVTRADIAAIWPNFISYEHFHNTKFEVFEQFCKELGL